MGFSDFSSVTGAVSTFGFVFYIQPIMMPLLSEMPATERGVRILSWSTRIVVLGKAAWSNYACCSMMQKKTKKVLIRRHTWQASWAHAALIKLH